MGATKQPETDILFRTCIFEEYYWWLAGPLCAMPRTTARCAPTVASTHAST